MMLQPNPASPSIWNGQPTGKYVVVAAVAGFWSRWAVNGLARRIAS